MEFEPGSAYNYSNTGYLLLASIIEKASGISYEQFLNDHIFKPLNMLNSGQETPEALLKNKVYGYLLDNHTIKSAPSPLRPITLLGNGDLYSTVEDLYKIDQALYSEKIINQHHINSLFLPHMIMQDSTRAHGYGWFIDKKYGRKVVEYSGALMGFISKITRFIDDQVCIIVLTNLENVQDTDH